MPGTTMRLATALSACIVAAAPIADALAGSTRPKTSDEQPAPPAEAEPAAPANAPRRGAVFPQSSGQTLGEAELSALDCDALWVARNEIFARNGYCFKTARGEGYFGNAGCRSSSADILSRIELNNVAKIKSWETRRGCN